MKRDTPEIAKAKAAIVRAAMGIVNEEGWSFQQQGDGGVPVVIFPGSMRRLESAIAKLKEARKKRKRGPYVAELQGEKK